MQSKKAAPFVLLSPFFFLHCCCPPAAACSIVYVHSRIQPPRNGSRLGDESRKMAVFLSFLVVCEATIRPFSPLERAAQAVRSVCRLFSFLPFFFFHGPQADMAELFIRSQLRRTGYVIEKSSGSEMVGTATKELYPPVSYTYMYICTYIYIYIHLFICLLIFLVCRVPVVLIQQRSCLKER